MSGGHGASRGSQQCRRRRRKGLAEKRRSSQRVGSGNVLFAFIKLALNKFHETACSRPQRIDAVGGGKSGRCYISRSRANKTHFRRLRDYHDSKLSWCLHLVAPAYTSYVEEQQDRRYTSPARIPPPWPHSARGALGQQLQPRQQLAAAWSRDTGVM